METIKNANEAKENTLSKSLTKDEILKEIGVISNQGHSDYFTPLYISHEVESDLKRLGFNFGIRKDLIGKELTVISWM